MRIDKYLKLTRLIKRRVVAKTLLERGVIQLNGKEAKPSSEVKVDDIIVLALGRHLLTIKVTNIKEMVKKSESSELYSILSDVIIDEN